jgi:Rieske Fe-S protein
MTLPMVTRRSALSGLAVAVVGGVVGFVVTRTGKNSKSAGTGANGYGAAPATGGRLLAPLDQVKPGGGLILASPKVVLTRGADGAVSGFSAVCTHQGCTVSSVTAKAIVCPCHGSEFDPQTGAVIAGPAPSPLPKVSVVVRDGNVYTN